VPLDADVALPATGTGPFPLIVLLPGLGGSKGEFEDSTNDGAIDDVTFASKGYAVLMYTARGFGTSCGTAASRAHTPACAKGWIDLADQRYEVRDTQYLAGMLVDEGLVKPAIAASGVSYGGGQSLELAMLKNRVRLPTGRFVPFTSPAHHVPMRIAAVYAMWPWDTLVTALVPNGGLSASRATPSSADILPAGVMKQSWVSALYAETESGYLAPPGKAPQSDLTAWYDELTAGEPTSPKEIAALRTIQKFKSSEGIPMPAGGPAPTAVQSGWTDTLFPVSEAQHYVNRVVAAHEPTPLLTMYDDVGHGWSQDKLPTVAATNRAGIAFLNTVMLSHRTPATKAMAFPVNCASSTAAAPRLSGPRFTALQHGSVQLTGGSPQTVTSAGGSQATAKRLDPTSAPLCDPLPATREPGTAVYSLPVHTAATQLVGSPTVTASLTVRGRFPELVGRLWDVSSSGTRQIVSLGVLRPSVNQTAGTKASAVGHERVSFQLNPTDYSFAPGDTIVLELVGSTSPLFRKSNGTFTIAVAKLTCTLPTAA
jgi:X-Pro dipeptidyl-peptidase C-terminal non-catalytic domain/X-Pro dipeptidyl-peptidase (S15 family)